MDQNVEKDWVSGITTISNRARYLSLIPWLVAEYYQQHGLDQGGKVDEPDEDDLIALTRRLEMVILAATRHTDSQGGYTTGGLIGPDLFVKEMAALEEKGEIALDLGRGRRFVRHLCSSEWSYSARNASVGSRRAARRAG